MKLRAVLFDLDDTLHDKSATLKDVAERQFLTGALESQGIDRSSWRSAFLELNNMRIEKIEVYARLGRRFALAKDLERKLLDDFDHNLGSFAKPYVGTLELLKTCKLHGLKIGIVTNGRDQFQRSKIKGLGISTFVDSVVTSGGFGVKKPDHSIFLECLYQLSVSPQQVAFVGDDFDADMIPTNALGLQAIWKSAATSSLVAFSSDSLHEIQHFLLRQFPPSSTHT